MSLRSILSKTDIDTLLARLGVRTDTPDANTLFGAINALGYNDYGLSEITPGNIETDMLEVLMSDAPDYFAVEAEAYIDLSPLQAGDTVVIKEYAATLATPLTYTLYATHTYTGVQTEPLVHFTKKMAYAAWKITAQQTAGVNREFRSVAYYRRGY